MFVWAAAAKGAHVGSYYAIKFVDPVKELGREGARESVFCFVVLSIMLCLQPQ